LTEEIWKPVEGYDHPYEVSNLGRLRGPRGMLHGTISHGHIRVTMRLGKRSVQRNLRDLVALAFVPNPEGLPDVGYINGCSVDCRAVNLQWIPKRHRGPTKRDEPEPAPRQCRTVPKCPADCIHRGYWDTHVWCCEYILNVGKRRPCPAGPECTVYVPKGRKKRNTWNDAKRKEDSNV